MRCLHQYHNGFPTPLISTAHVENEEERTHMELINHQIALGIDNLLSGALTKNITLKRTMSENTNPSEAGIETL